ncbi:unnamed protein product [Rhizopus stolonifer]
MKTNWIKTSEKLKHNRSVVILVPEAVDDEAHEVSQESVVLLSAVYFLDALLSNTSSINGSNYTGVTGTTTTGSFRYVLLYVDGFYPFRKFAWGEFANANDNLMALEKTFEVLLKLKVYQYE